MLERSQEAMDYSTFSNNVRMLIERRGMTVNSFCDDIGIPAPTISRYLTGEREPKFSYIVRIAEYFNVSLDWLVGINGEKFDVLPADIQDVVIFTHWHPRMTAVSFVCC